MSAFVRTVLITNKRGLHARASAKFVTMASGAGARVEVEKDGSKVVGTSIMGLMMLGAAMGDEITISANGKAQRPPCPHLQNWSRPNFTRRSECRAKSPVFRTRL